MPAHRLQKKPADHCGQVRIIAGKWRSRKIDFPSEKGLRPTADRIRETLFNWLTPHLGGSRCLDAFAGSGALGFEALSRGAGEVTFIDANPVVCDFLKRNSEKLEAKGAHIAQANLLEWLKQKTQTPFDIIFLDPPFADDLLNRCLDLLVNAGAVQSGTLIYLESPVSHSPLIPDDWSLLREKHTSTLSYRLVEVS